ncbi:MAG: hypothetical protein ACREF6_10120, partial [Alphaproteobacteria bacterium]
MQSAIRIVFSVAGLLAFASLPGCAVFTGQAGYFLTSAPAYLGQETYQPHADGAAAATGAIAIVPGLQLAFSSNQTGAPAGFGPGLARFNGAELEAFSMDGDLSTAAGAGSQPGFFFRPTSTYTGGAPGTNAILRSDESKGDHDGIIAWGTWALTTATLVTRGNDVPLSRPFASGVPGAIDEMPGGFFYVTGLPTQSLPQSGVARYSVIAGTHFHFGGIESGPDQVISGPLSSRGRAAGAEFSGASSLSVLWGGADPKIGLDLMWHTAAGLQYHMQTNGGADNPASSQISVRSGTATFGGTLNTFPVCPQGSTCTGSVEGFFAGPSAERAGLAYRVVDVVPGQLVSDIHGVAAFAFSQLTVPPAPPPAPVGVTLLSQTDPNAFAISFAHSGALAGQPAFGPPGTATQSAGGQLDSFANTGGSPGSQINIGRGTAQSPAAETGGDSLIT